MGKKFSKLMIYSTAEGNHIGVQLLVATPSGQLP